MSVQMQEALPEAFSKLGASIEDMAREHKGDERATVEVVAVLLRDALAAGLDIPAPYRRPDPGHYVMYPLYVAEDKSVSIASAVWNVGQKTPIHDHLTWGVIGIVSGTEEEVRYRVSKRGQTPPEYLTTLLHEPGGVTVCCTTDDDVHAVSCASDVPCVAIHVYGADIGVQPRRVYDPNTGQVSPFISAWAPVAV